MTPVYTGRKIDKSTLGLQWCDISGVKFVDDSIYVFASLQSLTKTENKL